MSTYLTPPGAWLSGWERLALGGLTPIDRARAHGVAATPIDRARAHGVAATPIDGNSAATPIDSQGQSAATPIDDWRRRVPQPTQAPLPWEGVDPQWVYGSGAAMLGQALRKTRAKILRPADDALAPPDLARAQSRGVRVRGTHLWRWAPEFRHAQLVGALLGRFQVHGQALWMLDPRVVKGAVTIKPVRVIEITPPTDNDPAWDEQIDKVLRAAVEREDRLPEILAQATDLWPFFESIVGLRLAALPRTAELLNIAHDAALHLTMGLKHEVAAQRPLHRTTRVMPVISTPAHGSLPSGHATLARLTADLLVGLLHAASGPSSRLAERREHLDRLARRIAFNRVVAGVHFPIDSVAGHALGGLLAGVFMALAGDAAAAPEALSNDDVWRCGDRELTLSELGSPADRPASDAKAGAPAPLTVARLSPWDVLWKAAVAELHDAGA